MTGTSEQSKSRGSGKMETRVMDNAVTSLPQSQSQQPSDTNCQQLLQLSPQLYHHLLHQGVLRLKPGQLALTHHPIPQGQTGQLALTHHPIPQGVNLGTAAWFQQETQPVHSGETVVRAPGFLTNDSYTSSARAPPIILWYSTGNGQTLAPTSNRERDAELQDPLFLHGFCKWPGCEQVFKEYEAFLKHLDEAHCLDEMNTAQCLIQKEKVNQLELKLEFEKDRLQAMQTQLKINLPEQHVLCTPKVSESPVKNVPLSCNGALISTWPRLGGSTLAGMGESLALTRHGPWDKHSTLPSDINPSLEYYKICNVRPPLTYAALIRWAILETPERQLTLNEIYHWFTGMFAFFRYNTATWKNAVRHNLSLHKCFVRVENIKGAVWTVDEVEFQRRRGQKFSRDPETRWSLP